MLSVKAIPHAWITRFEAQILPVVFGRARDRVRQRTLPSHGRTDSVASHLIEMYQSRGCNGVLFCQRRLTTRYCRVRKHSSGNSSARFSLSLAEAPMPDQSCGRSRHRHDESARTIR
jgi:hypothetical protein